MKDTIVLVTDDGMGHTEQNLQQLLFRKYTELLLQCESLPIALCFYTEGVKLVCEGSPVIEQLRNLENKGTRLIVCSTCLNYFELTSNVQVGIIGGRGDILEAQMKADKVITI